MPADSLTNIISASAEAELLVHCARHEVDRGEHLLMEPLNNRVWFAGEAAHETLWGTVGGAWESGERAADAVMRAAVGRRG